MSHRAYFQNLIGKTVKAVEHKEDGHPPHTNKETIVVTFEDGSEFIVFSHMPYALDALVR